MSSAPIVDRIRIIPRPGDFLDRNVGASGEVFFNRATNSLRVYSGKDLSGFEIARADLNNVSDTVLETRINELDIISESGSTDWNDILNKPVFSAVAETGSYNDLTDTPEIPDVSELATKDYVDSAVSSIEVSSGSSGSLFVAADDSTQKEVTLGETVSFTGGTDISTASDAEGNITINYTGTAASSFDNLTEISTAGLTVDKVYEPAIAMLRVDNVGTSSYTFPSHYTGENPTIYAIAGTTVAFDLDLVPGHPFEIQTPTGDPYNVGLVHVSADGTVSEGADAQGKDSGTLYWRIQESTSGNYRYQCQNHASMVGAITVKRLSVI